MTSIRCPNCRNKLLHKSGDVAKLRIDGPIEISEDGVCRSNCFWCSTPVELPLELSKSAAQIARPAKVPRTNVRFVVMKP